MTTKETKTLALDDIDKLSDELLTPKPKKGKKDMNKDQFTKTKQAHKTEIAKLKQDIKRHKLLIKQAKLVYRINRMKGTK